MDKPHIVNQSADQSTADNNLPKNAAQVFTGNEPSPDFAI